MGGEREASTHARTHAHTRTRAHASEQYLQCNAAVQYLLRVGDKAPRRVGWVGVHRRPAAASSCTRCFVNAEEAAVCSRCNRTRTRTRTLRRHPAVALPRRTKQAAPHRGCPGVQRAPHALRRGSEALVRAQHCCRTALAVGLGCAYHLVLLDAQFPAEQYR